MTTYYIRPELGSNSSNGLSWETAWADLYALRVQSIALQPGDSVRIEKSDTKTPTAYTYDSNGLSANAQVSGSTSAFVKYTGTSRMFLGGSGNSTWTSAQAFSTFSNSDGGPIMASSTVLNTPSIKLSYKASTANGIDLSAYKTLFIQLRMSTAYTGTGEQDIPPGTFEIWLCSDTTGTTPVQVIPIDIWVRNSTTNWSAFNYKSASNFPSNVNSVAIYRSSASLSRSAVVWGVQFSQCTFYKGWSDANPSGKDVAVKVTHTQHYNAGSTYYGHRNAPFGIGWMFNQYAGTYFDAVTDVPYAGPVPYQFFPPTTETASVIARVFEIKGLHMVGTSKWNSGLGSQIAAFDLNGSAGGTSIAPILIEGGYDVGTNTVTGETLFGGGHDWVTPYHFLDLQGAPYIKTTNISAFYGFSALIANPGTGLWIERCQFSQAPTPVHGATSSTNLTFNYCMASYTNMYGLGTVGDLTIMNSKMGDGVVNAMGGVHRTIYCRAFYAINSALMTYYDASKLTINAYEDSVVENFLFTGPLGWRFENTTTYGKTLTFKNLLTSTVQQGAAVNYSPGFFLTSDNSRWKKVIYENCDFAFLTTTYFTATNTLRSLDEEVEFKRCYSTNNTYLLLTYSYQWTNTKVSFTPENVPGMLFYIQPPIYSDIQVLNVLLGSRHQTSRSGVYAKHQSVYTLDTSLAISEDRTPSLFAPTDTFYCYPMRGVSGAGYGRNFQVYYSQGAWAPFQEHGTSFIVNNDPYLQSSASGLIALPDGVLFKENENVFYFSRKYSSVPSDTYWGNSEYPNTMFSEAALLTCMEGPMVTYRVQQGVTYRVKYSYNTELYGEVGSSQSKPLAVSSYVDANSPTVFVTLLIGLGCLSEGWIVHRHSGSGSVRPIPLDWTDVEFTFTANGNGEVSLMGGVFQAIQSYFNVVLVDAVKIEAIA